MTVKHAIVRPIVGSLGIAMIDLDVCAGGGLPGLYSRGGGSPLWDREEKRELRHKNAICQRADFGAGGVENAISAIFRA